MLKHFLIFFLPFLIINSGPSFLRGHITIREKPLNCQRQFSTNELFIRRRIIDDDDDVFYATSVHCKITLSQKNNAFSCFLHSSIKNPFPTLSIYRSEVDPIKFKILYFNRSLLIVSR